MFHILESGSCHIALISVRICAGVGAACEKNVSSGTYLFVSIPRAQQGARGTTSKSALFYPAIMTSGASDLQRRANQGS